MPVPSSPEKPILPARWATLIPEDQWKVFETGAAVASRAGVPFLMGGAAALATYTGRWRDTKDIDFIVRPEHHERFVQALAEEGFEDYHTQQAYDRSWIFRGFRDGVIFDVIWTLPNHRVDVDEDWFRHSRRVQLREHVVRSMALEDLIRVKLYVMQRERCDWVDVLNALAGSTEKVDWDYLMARMDRDLPLLQSLLVLFNWLCPGRARMIPAEIRQRFALPLIESDDLAAMELRRVRLLDSRPWFAPLLPEDQVLER